MFSFLPILLLAGGIYFITRKGADAAPAGGGGGVVAPPKELVTSTSVAAKFEKDMAALKAADPTFKGTEEKMARESFFGGDDRPRALGMMEFVAVAIVGNPLSPTTYSEAARKAAAELAIDFRDQFIVMGGRGDLADKLMVATKALIEKFKITPTASADPAAFSDVDKASVALIVGNTPFAAQSKEPVLSAGSYSSQLVDLKSGTEVGAAQVNLSGDFHLRSLSQKLGSDVFEAYIGRVAVGSVTGAAGSTDVAGSYVIAFAPRPAMGA